MTALLLRLAGPLQSWGTSSRFARRETGRVPSKSGVIGLLAAAQGRRRVDPIEDLVDLRVGVRIEQPGRIERDFQTARSRTGAEAMPLSYRFYLSDAVFLVAVEGEDNLLAGLRDAVRRPAYPLALGRRSCPPVGKLEHGLHPGDAATVLAATPWMASQRTMDTTRTPTVDLHLVADCAPDTPGADLVRDQPISFDPRHRSYGWRSVTHTRVTVPNPSWSGQSARPSDHNPMALLGHPL
ncbi:type I-E CRISPR-associated protein Cas5/CasD [Actinokineospora cianjurensis]|uniref:CRISPR-associated Cas5e family protein n=1 Tax=Actinokineospora cianjurensis TaxID=585224 RepID=A0A421B2S9_9PSEU|nr:type I-E CRISPR-associated protein Cas5/CasD [Actinokineospora cianjurensis]RLK58701.1 CRISPR-associated Cas5e family protein [Actinokineospora cianjurensis]